DDQDKANAHVGLAVALAIGAALIGIALSLLEHTRPIHNFRLEVQNLAKGGGPRRGPADLKEVLGDLPAEPQMSAFSFPGENMPSAPAAGSGPHSAPIS